jgi:hypothetical protein
MMHWLLALAAGVSFAVAPVRGHHSLSDYDTGREAKIEGVISQFQFVNPHPYLVLDVRDAGGAVQSWRLEMDNRYELSDIGMTKDTLKPGDRIVVSGSPGHTQSRILYIRKLDRPSDGYGFEQVGSRPQLRSRGR